VTAPAGSVAGAPGAAAGTVAAVADRTNERSADDDDRQA
jgi:hypothetical protein